MVKKIISLLLLLFPLFCVSQNAASDSVFSTIPSKYFEMNRENFHLQLNKNTYLTTENIWFKGFVFDKKNQQLLIETSNVHVNLLDENGTILDSKLCFASNGSFNGNFKLTDKLNSGLYYLQVYTNYSNNFAEDESGLFKIEIINPNSGQANYERNDPQISFRPEGGTFVENADNSIGIIIKDCLENGIEITDAKLFNSQNQEVISFKTNELGYGQFPITNAKNEQYKVRFKYKNKEYEKVVPAPQKNGIAMTMNNYANEKNVFVTLKTNASTLENEKQHDFYFVINQNDQVNFFKFKLEKTIQNLTLPEGLFYDGINIIRILDHNKTPINERIIYKKFDNSFNANYTIVSKTKDSVKIAATFLNKVSVGISVVPKESKSIAATQNIFNSLEISSYLKNKFIGKVDFFNDSSRKNHYILDLILLCEKSKYDWNSMKNVPKEIYSFNRGLTIKGTINTKTSGDEKIEMFSFLEGINETAYLNDKNEFYFKNLIVTDSTTVNFALRNDKEKKLDLNFYAQLVSEEKPFNKLFSKLSENCVVTKSIKPISETIDLPKIKDEIKLDDVLIKSGVKRKELENRFRNGNNNMRGFKISDGDYKMYTYLIPFLNSNGFNATSRMGQVSITSRIRNSLSRVNSPTVYLDEMELQEFDVLDNFSMQLIDEIFIDKYATNIQSKGGGGVIKIYTNQNYKSKVSPIKSKTFVVKNGFSKASPFVNPNYSDFSDEGFKNYGTISWIPNAEKNQTSVLFTVPTYGQKEVIICTEGISEDGKMISKITNLNIE